MYKNDDKHPKINLYNKNSHKYYKNVSFFLHSRSHCSNVQTMKQTIILNTLVTIESGSEKKNITQDLNIQIIDLALHITSTSLSSDESSSEESSSFEGFPLAGAALVAAAFVFAGWSIIV